MRVWRIDDDKTGNGPWYTRKIYVLPAHLYERANAMPSVHQDSFHHAPTGVLRPFPGSRGFVCGFRTKKAALKVFTPAAIRRLAKSGCSLKAYIVPDDEVLVGEYQVVFPARYIKEKGSDNARPSVLMEP